MSGYRPGPPVNRVPGATNIKTANVKDLQQLSYQQLLEIKERQGALLSSKRGLEKLPDKGKRLQDAYDKLLAEIGRRNDVDAAADMLVGLNIVAKGKTALNNLEWHGRLGNSANDNAHVADILDSDDELEQDPLRVMAQGTMHERQVKVLPPPETLITAADLADIAAFKSTSVGSVDSVAASQSSDTSSTSASECDVAAELIEVDAAKLSSKLAQPTKLELDQHTLYLINKTELQIQAATKERFLPFRTTISQVHAPENERKRKNRKHWDITAATPPLIRHKEVQLVPLEESAELQTSYMDKVKAQRVQQAEARLARQQATSAGILQNNSAFQIYRDPSLDFAIEGKQHASELNNEVHDPTDVEKSTAGITYNVYN